MKKNYVWFKSYHNICFGLIVGSEAREQDIIGIGALIYNPISRRLRQEFSPHHEL